MSTYQPPGEPPSYSPPQDPWAGETGVAAAPTDPIPQSPPQQQPPAYGQFTPGVASPSVWTQETISHGGYEYVPQRSRLGMYILVMLAVIVFGGGGGYGAYLLISGRNQTQNPPPDASTTPATSTTATTPGQNAVDPATLKVGDCIFNAGTSQVPTMVKSDCNKAQSYEVIKIVAGEQIPEGPQGTFDKDNTAPAMCDGTGYEAYYGWDSSNDKNDFFFCLTNN